VKAPSSLHWDRLSGG